MSTSGNSIGKRLMIGVLLLIGLVLFMPADSRAASMKIRMNGKTTNYKRTQSTVKYGTKKVLNKKYKGLTIKGTRMVPYDDVFKKGLKVKVKKSSSKKFTMTKNGMKVTMTLGSKTAYVNGKKRKLSTAPVKVKYVKKKKTKILVPTKFLCDQFGFNYKASSSTITITDGLLLEYNNTIKKSPVIGKLS